MPHGEVVSLGISGVFSEQLPDGLLVAKDDFGLNLQQAAPLVTMLDHLEILPVISGKLACRRTTPAPVRRDPPPDLDHGLGDASPPVRGDRGRGLRMPPAPQALEGLDTRLGLVFPEAPGGPQPGVDVGHGRAPEGAAGFGFSIVFFEPLFCT